MLNRILCHGEIDITLALDMDIGRKAVKAGGVYQLKVMEKIIQRSF